MIYLCLSGSLQRISLFSLAWCSGTENASWISLNNEVFYAKIMENPNERNNHI